MPHIPLYVPDDVRDPDPKRAYINTIEHIDAEVGRLLKTLDDLKLADNTYVIYTTDNGPWLPFRHHGGSAGPLRDGKGTTFEGGQRVPCVMRGPGIPAGTVCHELTGTIDLLPTIAALTGRPLPKGRKIDGLDVSGLWKGTQKNLRAKNSSTTPPAATSRAFAAAIGNCSSKNRAATPTTVHHRSSVRPPRISVKTTSPKPSPTSSKTSVPAWRLLTLRSRRMRGSPGLRISCSIQPLHPAWRRAL